MRALVESALSRKPLRLVRMQAHLGDGDSRYVPISILQENDDDDSTSATDTGGARDSTPRPTASSDPSNRDGGRGNGNRRRTRTAPLRHMSLFDLVAFGVGCTVGGGVFVLGGVSAHSYAGPSSSLSYLLSGCVVLLSALPYAELSSYFPVDGSTYSYAYISLGEIYAILSSMCQTLEYGVGASAVARSWGNKVVDLIEKGRGDGGGGGDDGDWMHTLLDPGYYVNPLAGIVSLLCTLILLMGVKESKLTTNIVSSMKVSLVTFMIVAGLLMSSGIFPHTEASFDNWVPFVPIEFGIDGVLEASSLLIFAYTGFDCICNQAGEAKDPVRDVPRAVVATILIDGALYVLAALALTSMLPYTEISVVSGFPDAFGTNGWVWAMWLTAIGELIVLPLVVLASIQAQTRLLFAMSADGIVPKFFGRLSFTSSSSGRCCRGGREDEIGNLSANVRFCGLATVVMATFVPFQYLIELVAAGALLLFSMTSR
jgi:APA family basic amino acid/polyamine antiporter